MTDTNRRIDQYLRKQRLRHTLVISTVAFLFLGFMSYALYMEYGPDAEITDYFPETTQQEQ